MSKTATATMHHHKHKHSSSSHEEFDIRKVVQLFEQAKSGDSDVHLAVYIEAWRELNSMFPLFGRLFTFVQSDVAEKEEILQAFVDGEHKEQYRTVSSMMEHEMKEKTVKNVNPPSASRTLLRLHRALEFVIAFIRDIHESEDHASMSHTARAAYDRTLAHHHGWFVRQGVHAAVWLLPNRKQLISQLCHGQDHDESEASAVMSALVEHSDDVYQRCQTLYVKNELTQLP